MTTFVPDQFGTYLLALTVTDSANNRDTSEIELVATGAITSVDAGVDGAVTWLDTAQLTGQVSTAPGELATVAWKFVSQPAGSTTALVRANTLTPTFVADATGTYIVELDANVGDEVRQDTVSFVAIGVGVALGTNVAYTYSKKLDRLVYARDVGHTQVVNLDPTTGATATIDDPATTSPRSLSVSEDETQIGLGALGRVVMISATSFQIFSAKAAPGCTASHVVLPLASSVIDCYPVDGTIEKISEVNMSNGGVSKVVCPVKSPDAIVSGFDSTVIVDGATPQFLFLSGLMVTQDVTIPGVAPPVIAGGVFMTGNGLAVDGAMTPVFDLKTKVAAGAFSKSANAFALVSPDAHLQVFGEANPQPLLFSAILPQVNGVLPSPKFAAYSADEHRLFVVAGTATGDVVFTVPQ
jgi:hypothetical protein